MLKIILVVMVAVGLVLGVWYFVSAKNSENVTSQENTTENVAPSVAPSVQSDTSSFDGTVYVIAEPSTVSYVVQKRFLQKAHEQVEGVTSLVTGQGLYNSETNQFELEANVDLTGLKTDNQGRDADILKLFTPTSATIVINSNDNPNFKSTQEQQELVALVTINGVTKQIPIKAIITMNNNVTVTGEANFKMSDFGVTPPSAVGIYTVDDDLVIKINISATPQ